MHCHLFLLFPVALDMWNGLFAISDDNWVVLRKVEDLLLTCTVDFGRHKDKRILWNYVVFSVFWCLWMEWNARIF